jgi:hypothetical protein
MNGVSLRGKKGWHNARDVVRGMRRTSGEMVIIVGIWIQVGGG